MSTTAYPQSTSLYVGDLHQEVDEKELNDLFCEIGPVQSVKLNRDAGTRRSLCYAYVNFLHSKDAERALDTLNYSSLKGKQIRIMWSQRDPSMRRSGIGNIFIKNLHPDIDNKVLYDTFSAFGNILSCKVAVDGTGKSRGFGFVHFETEDAAAEAIAKVNEMLLGDKKVFVGPFISQRERMSGTDGFVQFTNIYVKDFDTSWDDEALEKFFTPYGTIQSAVVMRNEDGSSKGFGFINFADHEGANRAVEEVDGKDIDGRVLYVSRHQRKTERQSYLRRKFDELRLQRQSKYQGVNLYVKNLHEGIDDDKLRDMFSKFGTITSAKVMNDDKDVTRGFGFVCFSAPDEATRAITEMSGVMNTGKPLYVALAQRKETRRAEMESEFAQRMRNPMSGGQPQMFPGGPMFYAQPGPGGMPGAAPQGFVYPAQMGGMRGGRWAGPMPQSGPQAYYQAMPYPMANMNRRRAGRNAQPQGQVSSKESPSTGISAAAPRGGAQPAAAGRRGRGGPQYGGPQGGRVAREGAPGRAHGSDAVSLGPQAAMDFSNLSDLPAESQRRQLGDALYFRIRDLRGDAVAPKITGMLLEMETSEILHMLENPDFLSKTVEDAAQVLEEHARQKVVDGAEMSNDGAPNDVGTGAEK